MMIYVFQNIVLSQRIGLNYVGLLVLPVSQKLALVAVLLVNERVSLLV